jgi:hypothetical protein
MTDGSLIFEKEKKIPRLGFVIFKEPKPTAL